MSWYDKDEDLFCDTINNIFPENKICIDGFMRHNNDINDFDVKMDEFILDKSETKSNSKIFSPVYDSENSPSEITPIPKNKIFQVNKEELLKEKSINSTKNDFTGKDILSHPFLVSNNTTTVNSTKQNLNISEVLKNDFNYNIQQDQFNQEDMHDNDSLINNDSIINNNYIKDYNNEITYGMSLTERMKIKKAKAKLLLEKKTKRNLNEVLSFNQLQKTEINPKNRILNNESDCPSFINNSNSNNKKEIKMLRNRISAQKSRDRKKKEFDELKLITENFYRENCSLKNTLINKDKEINKMKEILNKLCENCQIINKDSIKIKDNKSTVGIIERNARNFTSTLKYSLMTGLFVIVCLIGALSFNNFSFNENSVGQRSNNRILNVINKKEDNYNLNEIQKSTEIAVYGTISEEKQKNEKPSPFIITKDYNKIAQKKIIKSETDQLFIDNKSNDFYERIHKQLKENKSSFGFLQNYNDNNMCIATDNITYNIENYIERDLDLSEGKNLRAPNENKSLILKTDEKNYNINNQILSIKDLRNNYEREMRHNINSMYCRDFITAEKNSEIFKNLFTKFNENMEKEEIK